jgi:long-chain acyl-CoA synthetase
LRRTPTCVDERMAAITADDTAVIIYTSGTTGRPKGAMLSHNNILKITESFATVNATNEKDEMLSYLPLAHIYENMISLFQAVWGGGTVNFVESLDTLTYNLREVSPRFSPVCRASGRSSPRPSRSRWTTPPS